ncbi:MAG: hypothetical protein ACR2G2_16425 [Pseudonocardia sp.]
MNPGARRLAAAHPTTDRDPDAHPFHPRQTTPPGLEQAGLEQAGLEQYAPDQRAHPVDADPDSDVLPDVESIRMRKELRRRVHADHPVEPAGPRPPLSGGRHARLDAEGPVGRGPRLAYVPRHAVSTPGPSAVSAHSPTEQIAMPAPEVTDITETIQIAPAVDTAAAIDPGSTGAGTPAETLPPGKRVRVVLSQRKGAPPRPVQTVVDMQELTQVGELLSASLIRSQLNLAVRIGGIATIALGSLPAIFMIFPVLGRVEFFGLRLPWLLLGGLSYPFLLGLGYLHARSAERLEQIFADHIQN